MSTISSFRSIENKHGVYKDKDCKKKFCESLAKPAIKIIILKRKKWTYWRKSSRNYIKIQKSVIFVKDKLYKCVKDKKKLLS